MDTLPIELQDLIIDRYVADHVDVSLDHSCWKAFRVVISTTRRWYERYRSYHALFVRPVTAVNRVEITTIIPIDSITIKRNKTLLHRRMKVPGYYRTDGMLKKRQIKGDYFTLWDRRCLAVLKRSYDRLVNPTAPFLLIVPPVIVLGKIIARET